MRKITLILASLLALGAVSCTGGKQDEKPVAKEIGVQLYSIRDVIGNPEAYARNHEEAFKALAQMGYTSVEAACYSDGKLYGVDPEQYKADLEAAGLKSLSTHIGRNLSDEELASGDFTEVDEVVGAGHRGPQGSGMQVCRLPFIRCSSDTCRAQDLL